MYVRRKVFSILQDENGEERLFSVNEVLLENGEEQREFGEKKDEEDKKKKKLTKGQKAALIAAGTALGAGALVAGGKIAGKKITKNNYAKMAENLADDELSQKYAKRAYAGIKMQAPADVITKGAKAAYEGAKAGVKKATEKTQATYYQTLDKAREKYKELKAKGEEAKAQKLAEKVAKAGRDLREAELNEVFGK